MPGGEQESLHPVLLTFNGLGSGPFCGRQFWSKDPKFSGIFVTVDEGIVYDHLSSLQIKSECHFPNTGCKHCIPNGRLLIRFAVKQQEATTASSGDFPAQRAVASGERIEFIDMWVRNLAGDPTLGLPCLVQELTKLMHLSLLQSSAHLGS